MLLSDMTSDVEMVAIGNALYVGIRARPRYGLRVYTVDEDTRATRTALLMGVLSALVVGLVLMCIVFTGIWVVKTQRKGVVMREKHVVEMTQN